MFGFNRKPTQPRARYNITRDGHGDWRVEPAYLTERKDHEMVQTKESVSARIYFAAKTFGNQIQAEKAIADFEEIQKLDERQVIAQVF